LIWCKSLWQRAYFVLELLDEIYDMNLRGKSTILLGIEAFAFAIKFFLTPRNLTSEDLQNITTVVLYIHRF